MLRLELIDGQLREREAATLGRIEVVPNTRDLCAEPIRLTGIDIIVLEFPSFKDGRAFTQARELREQGFEGDIRATGGFFCDQVPMAVRCGFTSFDIETSQTKEALQSLVDRYAHAYQRPGRLALAREARA